MMRAIVVAGCVVAAGAWADPRCENPTWSTIDDFVLPGAVSSSAGAVTQDGDTLWVAGTASDTVTSRWVVRRRINRTSPFVTVDDFVYTTGARNVPSAILVRSNSVFVSGGANDSSEVGKWLVRRSTNGGSSWSIADVQSGDSTVSHAYAMSLDGAGALLVAGYANKPTPSDYHWYTRRSTDLGVTWAQIDVYTPIVAGTAPRGMALDKAGSVFAAGYNWNGRQYRWQTRRQTTPGGPWTLVDDWTAITDDFAYSANATFGAQPDAVATGKNPGTALVIGTAYQPDGKPHWVVRRTMDAGATWIVVDDLADCMGRGISFDKKDEKGFYAVGRCRGSAGAYRWITRRSDGFGSNWVTEDDWALAAGYSSYGNAIDFGKHGGLYAVGMASDGATTHWIVRARSCGAATISATGTSSRRR